MSNLLLSDEEIRKLKDSWIGCEHTISGELERFIQYCCKAQLSKLQSVDMGTVREELIKITGMCQSAEECDPQTECSECMTDQILTLIQPLLAQAAQKGKTDVVEKIKAIPIPDIESGDDYRYYRDYILGELEA